MRPSVVLVPLSVILAACANPPGHGPGSNDAPAVAEIVCEADGSTSVRTPEVRVQPDGIHVHVVSRLDEPAELIGLQRDVDPGGTTFVTTAAPGALEVGCHPFSRHGDAGDDPTITRLEALDPQGLYTDGEIQCTGTMSSGIADFAEAPLAGMRVPLDTARSAIRGLGDDDVVFYVGYPEQPEARIGVRRDGQIVATFSFVTFDGEGWVIEGSSICSSSGLAAS